MLESMFATLKFLFVATLLGPVTGLIGIPLTLLTGDISWMYRRAMAISALSARAAGVSAEITGRENIPAGRACIFMCNHVSNLDPPLLLPVLPGRVAVMLKSELMSIPILGTAMRLGGFIPVERTREPRKAKAALDAAADALRMGLHIVTYPEGSRSRDGRLSEFKKGAFLLARLTGAPIVPVALSGTQKMMPPGSWRIEPGTAQMKFLPVIESAQYASREELMSAVHAAIDAALPAEMQSR